MKSVVESYDPNNTKLKAQLKKYNKQIPFNLAASVCFALIAVVFYFE